MTTARTLIEDAYRQDNLIPLGQAILPEEEAEGLRRLNAMLAALFDEQVGEKLLDWPAPPRLTAPVAADPPFYPAPVPRNDPDIWRYPPENARLLAAFDQPETIYLHYKPQDGALLAAVNVGLSENVSVTLDANGRRIAGAPSLLLPELPEPLFFVYRADRAEWMPLTDLTIDSQSPLPPSFDDFLVCGLSMMLSARRRRSARSTRPRASSSTT